MLWNNLQLFRNWSITAVFQTLRPYYSQKFSGCGSKFASLSYRVHSVLGLNNLAKFHHIYIVYSSSEYISHSIPTSLFETMMCRHEGFYSAID